MCRYLLIALLLSLNLGLLSAQRGLNLDFEQTMRPGAPPGAWQYNGREFRTERKDDGPASGSHYLELRSAPGIQDTAMAVFVQQLPPGQLAGRLLRLVGKVRGTNQTNYVYAGLFVNAFDAEGEVVAFENTYDQALDDTGKWTTVAVSVNVPPTAVSVNIGGLFSGRGVVHFDDLELYLDGQIYVEPGEETEVAELLVSPTLPDDPRLEWLRQYVHPLESVDPEFSTADDLIAFGEAVSDCTVVGLGESTHGSREIFQLKDRLFRFLHRTENFGTFTLEGSLTEAYAVNKYIVEGVGTPTDYLNRIGFWTWRTEELAALIEGMRKSGTSPPPRFTGIDLQNYMPAYRALEQAFAGNNLLQEQLVAMRNKLDLIRFDRSGGADYEAPQRYLDLIDGAIANLYAAVAVGQFPERDQTWLRQMVRLIEQFSRMDSAESRDRYMAENTAWVQAFEGDSKLVLWAHNEHVKKTGDWLGRYLTEKFGEDYVSVAFSFSDGEYTASENGVTYIAEAERPYPATYEYWFDRLNTPRFYIDLRQIRKDDSAFAAWFKQGLSFRKVGTMQPWSEFQPEDLLADYDLLFFVGSSTASRPLPVAQRANGQ